jgi:hypothetical protein
MQEVSDWEERAVCPNSYKYDTLFGMYSLKVQALKFDSLSVVRSPFNWYQCGNEGISSKRSGSETQEYNEGVEDCLSEETKLFADVNIQPLHLKCKDPALCRTDGDFT